MPPLLHSLPLHHEMPGLLVPAADMRNAQKVKGVRPALSTLLPIRRGKPPELDQGPGTTTAQDRIRARA
jgi:hypothetical protein